MADFTVDPGQIAEARKAGYSDAEIVGHLADKAPEKFKAAADAGYTPSEILQHLSPPKDTSILGGLGQGVSNTIRGIGETIGLANKDAEATGDKLADHFSRPNYEPAKVVQDGKLNAGEIPRAVAEAAPGVALPIAVGSVAKRFLGTKGGLLAGGATALLQQFGPNVKERAANEGHETPTGGDMAIGGGTALAQTAASTIPLARFLPGANPVTSVGIKGIADSAKKLGITAVTEAGASGVQNAMGQVGATAGTPGGTQFDPNQAASAAITGGVTGATLAAPRGVADVHLSNKYRNMGGENQASSEAIAQRLQAQAGSGNLADPAVGKQAFERTSQDIQKELRDAASSVGATHPEVQNALARAGKGEAVTPYELQLIRDQTAGHPDAANLEHLVRQVGGLSQLRDMGKMTPTQFTGGIAGTMAGLRPVTNPAGTVLSSAAMYGMGHAIPGFIGMYAPHTVAAFYGAYHASKVLDKLTGLRSPAQSFANRFGNTDTPVRMAPQAAPPAPSGPMAGPTGPSIPLRPSVTGAGSAAALGLGPWSAQQGPVEQPSNNNMMKANVKIDEGMANIVRRIQAEAKAKALTAQAPAPENPLPSQIKDATDLMDARRANAGLRLDQAPAGGQIKDALDLMSSRRAQAKLAREQARQDAENAPVDDTPAEPNPILGAKELIKGLSNTAKIKAKADKATPIVSPQPDKAKAIAEPDPIAATKALVKNLTAATKIKARSVQDTPVPTPDPVQVAVPEAPPVIQKVTKANGKVQTVSALRDASPEAPAFAPKTPEELPFYGQEHSEVADAKMKSKYPNVKPGTDRYQVVRDGIISGRLSDETAVNEAAKHLTTTEEHAKLLDLLEEFHHTSSERRAREARDHYASLLPPAAKAQVLKSLNDAFIHKSKHKN